MNGTITPFLRYLFFKESIDPATQKQEANTPIFSLSNHRFLPHLWGYSHALFAYPSAYGGHVPKNPPRAPA